MKQLTMVRCLDNLGRLVIPAELRRAMGIAKGDPVQMRVEGKTVIVEKHKDSCILCGKSEDLFEVKDHKKICVNCMREMAGLVEKEKR